MKADEKSTNSVLTWVLVPSRCLRMRLRRVMVASWTPLLVLYANCRGSSRWFVFRIMLFLTSFSNDFITSDVSAMGLKSFKVLGWLCFAIGTIVDCFYISGTV